MKRKGLLNRIFWEEIKYFRCRQSRLDQWAEFTARQWQERLSFDFTGRVSFLFLILFFSFFLLLSRLFFLQIVEGGKNWQKSQENRIRLLVTHAPRGIIYDRKGKILARNKPGFRLSGEDSVRLLDYDEALSLAVKDKILEVDPLRDYPEGEIFAHILGYTSEISRNELALPEFAGYRMGDRIGRLGVEETFEKYLRGREGKKLVEVDALGREVAVVGEEKPESGAKLFLTIDADLQKVMYSALKVGLEKADASAGVVIAEDPKNGQILGLVSLPSFDPNLFSKGSYRLTELFSNPSAPLLNRATRGLYPPGSVFKMVTALAGLSSGQIDRKTKFEDTGVVYLGSFRFANWYYTFYGKTEGFLDIVGAIRRSNDIFFYKVGQLVGPDIIAKVAHLFGLGEKTGIDLPREEEGLVPTPVWKRKHKKEDWFPGNTLHLAIGQGDILTTPLQISNLVSAIANGGVLFRPYVGMRIEGKREKIVFKPQIWRRNFLKREHLELIREGMREACQRGGTGWPFFDFPVPVGCKTGTAEFGSLQKKTHAWFTVFAPFSQPEIVITVLVEGGGEGSSVAAPIAKEILKYWFARE